MKQTGHGLLRKILLCLADIFTIRCEKALWRVVIVCGVFAVSFTARVHAVDEVVGPAELVTINANSSVVDTSLNEFIYYFADGQGLLQAEEVIRQAKKFIPLRAKTLKLHTKTHWYWLRIHNPSVMPAKWFINTGVSTPPLLRAYWLQAENATLRSPQLILPSHTIYVYPSLLLPIELAPGEQGDLLIEYQSLANFPLTIRLNDVTHLLAKGPRLYLTNGVYLGAMVVLFLFFFSQFAINRNRVYFYYSMFVLFTILTVLHITGIGFGFISRLVKLDSTLLAELLGGGIYIFYFLFSTEFFHFKERNPFLHRLFIGLAVAVTGLTLLAFILPTDYLLSAVVAVSLPWPIIGAIWALRNRYPSAAFFLVGSTAHCIAAYFLLLACLGLETSRNNFLFLFACMGLIIDILCFAVAIIYQSHRVHLKYNRQLQARIDDLQILTESEQVSAQALMMSKQTVLNMAATAHDLQQPLSSMQLLLSLRHQADPVLDHIQTALDYARNLVHSALGDTKQQYLAITEKVDARLVLQAALQRHGASHSGKKVSLSLRCASLPIICLPLVLHRILDNLISNAEKYTPSGKILVSGRKRGATGFLIQVWDTGQGLDVDQVKTIVAPFARLAEVENLGFGLGLFIVKSLCFQAGYQFAIRSEVGRGSCFSIFIPDALPPTGEPLCLKI